MNTTDGDDSVFHVGERDMQNRYGVLARNLELAARLMTDSGIPLQHQLFYAQLEWLCVAWRELDGLAKAERLVEIEVQCALVVDHGFPFRGVRDEPSKHSVTAGVFAEPTTKEKP